MQLLLLFSYVSEALRTKDNGDPFENKAHGSGFLMKLEHAHIILILRINSNA